MDYSLLSGRRQMILALLEEQRTIPVQELMRQLRVSPATIRRDLSYLEGAGLVQRTHGEVHSIHEPSCAVPPAQTRSLMNSEKKELIAEAAAGLVRDGMAVLLDSGSTTLAIAKKLADKQITVVTNSLDIAFALANTAVSLISCGGLLQSNQMCFLGPDAERFIADIEVEIAFVGATGIRGVSGLTTSSPLQYNIKRYMLAAAKQKYCVFDSSKFDSANIYLFTRFSDLDGVITTRPTDPEAERKLSEIKRQGPKMLICGG